MASKELKEKLTEYDMSQSETARQLDMSQQSFNQALMVNDVKHGLLECIAQNIGLSLSFFYPKMKTLPLRSYNKSLATTNSNISFPTTKGMKKALIFILFAIAFVSCSTSSESENEKAEVYSSYSFSVEPIDEKFKDKFWHTSDEAFLNIFKPTLVEEDGELTRDTIGLKTTKTNYRLVIQNSAAELEVKTNITMKERVSRCKKRWYVFKAGIYQVDGVDKYEVKQDGIYLVDSGEKYVNLDDFRSHASSEKVVISSEDITVRYTTIAKGPVSSDVFLVSKADTTYKCSRNTEKEIQLDMVLPQKQNCTVLKKE